MSFLKCLMIIAFCTLVTGCGGAKLGSAQSEKERLQLASAAGMTVGPGGVMMPDGALVRPDGQIRVQEIHFDPGSAHLTPGGVRKTLVAAEAIRMSPPMPIRIVGFSDTKGSAQAARDLSCPRSDVVVRFDDHEGHETPTAEGCGARATYSRAGGEHVFALVGRAPIGAR